MTNIIRAKSHLAAPKAIDGFDQPREPDPRYPQKLYAAVEARDNSGDILVTTVNLTAGHIYEVRCSIHARYDNDADRFRAHLYEGGTLVAQVFSNTWGSQYTDSVSIEHVAVAASDGAVEYKLNLADWSTGVFLNRYSMVIMDLGPHA